MKTQIAALALVLAAMLTPACEQHKWDETKQLFKEGGHAGKEGGHGKPAGTGEKKAGDAKH